MTTPAATDLAAALVASPQLLVLDEPTTGLLCVALTAIFAPLALARYRRVTRG